MDKILCIDLGSTNIKMHINNDEKDFFDIQPSGRDISIEVFKKYVYSFLEASCIKPEEINGISVAFPGIAINGKIEKSFVEILNNTGYEFLASLSDKVVFINDANSALMYSSKQNPTLKSISALTVGTDIGFSLLYNGEIFTGGNNKAGEYQYYSLLPNGEFYKPRPLCTGSAILNLLNQGLSLEKALDETAKNLVCLITQVHNFYDPELIYLSGGAFRYDGFYELVKNYLKPLCSCKLQLSDNSVYAGCLGAKHYFETYYNR